MLTYSLQNNNLDFSPSTFQNLCFLTFIWVKNIWFLTFTSTRVFFLYPGICSFTQAQNVDFWTSSKTQGLSLVTLVRCEGGHLVPGKHSEGSVSLDDAAHHADLLRPEQLQGQSLARDQHHSRVWQHGDGLAAVVVVDRATVKLLHVWAKILEKHSGSQLIIIFVCKSHWSRCVALFFCAEHFKREREGWRNRAHNRHYAKHQK